MKPGDLSESNLVKPRDYSKLLNVLVYALAVISGMIMFAFIFFIYALNDNYLGWKLGLVLFITFLAIGAIFGFTRNISGWRLGLSLGSLPFVCVLFMLWSDGNHTLYDISKLIIVLAMPEIIGGCIGVYFGANYKQRRRKIDSVV
jgi:peptidoglycan/LPS O-acetylase OafA/YrhL